MFSVRNLLFSAAAVLGMTSPVLGGGEGEGVVWQRGWIAQSFALAVGTDAPKPTPLLLSTWHDSGAGLISTDYLFAYDGQRTFIFNAGILRTGAIRISQPGKYRMHVYIDRFLGHGQPECRARLAIDGTTVLDSAGAFSKRELRELGADEAQHAITPVFQVDEPGYYRLDFWSVCRDLNDKQAAYKLSNELGVFEEKRGIFSTKLVRQHPEYGDDSQLVAVQEHRRKTNPIKQVISENHGTVYDLVLENMITGEKGRITGETIYHDAAHTPSEKLEFQSVKPAGQGAFEASPWLFTGIRGDMSARWTQDAGYSPAFGSAAAAMPFHPSQVEARKRLTIKEAGTFDIAIGYEPEMSASAFQTRTARVGHGGQQQLWRPKSEPIAIFLEKRIDGGRVRRLKLYEDVLVGSNHVGEVEFMKINLQEGEYDIVITRNGEGTTTRGRYGDIEHGNSFTNSQLSIRMKREDEPGFSVVN